MGLVPSPGSARSPGWSPAARRRPAEEAVPGAALARPRAWRTLALASLVVAVTIGAACSSPGGDGSTQVAREPVLDHAPLDWADGHDHVVVYADPPEPAPAEGSDTPSDTPAGTPADPQTGPARDRHAPLPGADQTFELTALDGSIRAVEVPEGALVAVLAVTAGEADELARVRAEGGVALLVADPSGVVGAPGGRYVMTSGRLVELPPVGDLTAPTASTPDGDAASAPASPTEVPTSAGEDPAGEDPAGEDTAGEDTDGETAADDATWATPTPSAWTAAATADLLGALRAVDGVVSAEQVAPGVVAVATDGPRDALAAVPGVQSVADDVLLDYAVDERQSEQWALENTGAGSQAGGWPGVAGADTRTTRAWSVSEGAGVVVAVVDSGVDLEHEDLTTRLWTNTDEVCANGLDDDANGKVDDCLGWDFGVGDANPRPDALVPAADHGTHVAGIIAAGRNGIGVVGVAPAATVMPLKVANAAGAVSTSAVYAAIVYAVDEGADIINLSLATRTGTARSSVSALETGITYARSRGVLVVAGAGNDGVDITTRTRAVWPAGFSLLFDNVVTAGASTNTDERASFSNFGDPVTVWAPGWWMLSTVPGGYGWKSGTSMAAPMAAGAAADVIASGLATTPSEVRDRLVETAEVLDLGYRLDVAAAVGIPPDADIDVTYAGVDDLVPDQVADLSIHVSARSLPVAATHLRLSLASAVDYDVYAVGGLAVSLAPAGGAATIARSDAAGAFPLVPIADPAVLAGAGWDLSVSLALPVGDYAFLTELLDGTGTAIGGAQVAYVTVGAGLPVTSTTVSATTLPTSTTTGGTTTVPPGASTTLPDAPTTTVDDAVTTTVDAVTTTVAGGGVTTTTDAEAGATTTLPDAGPTTTTAGGAGTTTTDAATTTVPAATTSTTAATTTVAPTTTAVAATTTTAAPGSTTTSTSPPSATTTPPPAGDTDGSYRIDGLSPRYATLDGTTALVITGIFPQTIPVYVWFGDKGIVEAASADGETIELMSPEVVTAGITDVSVRFTLDRAYRLTLTDAFTFGAAPSGGGTTTTTAGSGGATTTLPGGATTTTVPGAATTTTVAGATTTTVLGATTTTTTAAGATTTSNAAAPTTTLPITSDLTLQPLPATGPLAGLTTTDWPRPGCRTASCAATPRVGG